MDGQGRPWPDEGPPLKRGSMWPAVSQCNWTQEFGMRVVGVLMPRPVMSDEQRWGRQREPSTLEPKEQGFRPACRPSAITVSTVSRSHTRTVVPVACSLEAGSWAVIILPYRALTLHCSTSSVETRLPQVKPVTWLFHRIPEQSSHAKGYNEIARLCRVMKRPFFKKKITVFHDSSVFSYMKILGI